MNDDKLQKVVNAGARGDLDEYYRLLSEQENADWGPELLNRAVDVATQYGCMLKRSANGLGTGPNNMGGIRITERETGRIVAGGKYQLQPAGVLAHFGIEL
ncbi:hypothetical protein D3C84_610250 [compost metagenome]